MPSDTFTFDDLTAGGNYPVVNETGANFHIQVVPANGMILPINGGGGDIWVQAGSGLVEQWLTNQSSGNETGVNGSVFTAHGSPGSGTLAGGPCRTFGGSADWFSITGTDPLNLDFNNVTLAVALKPTALGGQQIVFASLNPSGFPFYMVRCENTDLVLYSGSGGGAFTSHIIASGITNGTTYVVIANFQNTGGGSANWRVRVNGGSVQTFTGAWNPGTVATTVSLGAWTGGQFFNGSIALPTLWKVALTDQGMLDWYNSGTPIRYG